MPLNQKQSPFLLTIFLLSLVFCLPGYADTGTVRQVAVKTDVIADDSSATIQKEVTAYKPEQDFELQEVIRISEAGAPGLALQVMDRSQQSLGPDKQRWVSWEKQRLQIYVENQDWQALITRVKSHTDTIPITFSYWARTKLVEAQLQLQQTEQARLELIRLMLSTTRNMGEQQDEWLQQWRHLIIQSYITAGGSEDALTAILRFQQDYSVNKKEITLLMARVMLMTRRASEAIELLGDYSKDEEGAMLLLLAQLRSEARPPMKVLQAALRHLRNKKTSRLLRSSLWAIVAEAAIRVGDRGSAVNAFENVMADQRWNEADRLFEFNVDSLWNAYIDYALYSANQAQLLIGQDEAWFKFAKDSVKKYPLRARAVYALLMHRSQADEDRLKAAGLFVSSIQKVRNNSTLILKLFTASSFYSGIDTLPEPVKRSLVDIALAKQDVAMASKVMAGLSEPPPGNDSYMWHLRRARILIMGGQPQQGATALEKFTEMYPNAGKQQLDRFLQVVFDLQTVGEHDAAYQLFDDVIKSSKDKKLHRELYYWMADSRNAQSRHAEAAEHYLKSAMLLDGKGLDPWGQTARFHAAKALGKAGLYEDANTLFQALLRVTKEEDRRAVLRYEVQKLKLAKSETNERSDATDNGGQKSE